MIAFPLKINHTKNKIILNTMIKYIDNITFLGVSFIIFIIKINTIKNTIKNILQRISIIIFLFFNFNFIISLAQIKWETYISFPFYLCQWYNKIKIKEEEYYYANSLQYIFNSIFDSIYFYNKNDERNPQKSNIIYIFNHCVQYYFIFSVVYF